MIAPARQSLPKPTVSAEWETGRALGLEPAIELALAGDSTLKK
jgi:hypothetical protein